mgnify:CR=1 FL=1
MQVYSMTGYGKGVSESQNQRLTIELKAVNHRFLDLNVKLPKGFTFAEDIIRKIVKDNAVRGHFDIFVNYEDSRQDKAEVTVDYALATKYFEIATKISELIGKENNVAANELMRMSDIITPTTSEQDEEFLAKLVQDACKMACDNINVMRAKEGSLIMADLLAKVTELEGNVQEIEKLAPSMVEEHKTKLQERIQEALQDVVLDEARLLNEVAFYSDKVCVDEEITRLFSHITHFRTIVQAGGAVGKKLDFIVQEMNRETNTIGSKCCNIAVTDKVLSCKNLIEKIREQIQNIE